MDGTGKSGKEAQEDKVGTTGNFPLEYSGEVEVTHLPEPPRAPEEKQIHQRRPLPLVPEGDDAPDPNPSSPEQTD